MTSRKNSYTEITQSHKKEKRLQISMTLTLKMLFTN
jgi:hypothetical protein